MRHAPKSSNCFESRQAGRNEKQLIPSLMFSAALSIHYTIPLEAAVTSFPTRSRLYAFTSPRPNTGIISKFRHSMLNKVQYKWNVLRVLYMPFGVSCKQPSCYLLPITPRNSCKHGLPDALIPGLCPIFVLFFLIIFFILF